MLNPENLPPFWSRVGPPAIEKKLNFAGNAYYIR